MHQPAESLTSPADFTTKLANASKGTRAAGESAASNTFGQTPSFHLGSEAAPEADELVGRRRLGGAFLIEVARIHPDPNQPRRASDDERQKELTASVIQLGILQPIAVRYLREEKLYRIISGERRHRASQAAGLKEIPCWVQNPDEKDILIRQISENWQRAELHPMDLALSLAKLRDTLGHSQKEIAQLTGKSEAEVSKFLKLLEINPAVQEQARNDATGEVSRRHLLAIAQEPDHEQVTLFSEVRDKKLTAVETEKLVRDRKAERIGIKKRGAPPGMRFRLQTAQATVLVNFRRSDAGPAELLAALHDAVTQTEAKLANMAR